MGGTRVLSNLIYPAVDPTGNGPMAEGLSYSSEPSLNPWWRIGDVCVLGLWTVIVAFTINHHEKWADESQAWLIARDLDLRTIWFHELRYEGSPGLWHTILWVTQHIFHASYGALSYLGAFFAFAGIVALLFISPFPRPIRWLMAFGYYFVYQYAVVARSYVLFPLCCFLVARQFRDIERPHLFALALAPLASLTTHGSLMALALAFAYAIRFQEQWSQHNKETRRRFAISVAAIALMYVLLFFVLRPAPDVEVTHQGSFAASVILQGTLQSIVGALLDNTWLSLLVFLILGVWCFMRRALLSFLLPVMLLAGLCGYAKSGFYQYGTIFLAMITGLAIAWPNEAERRHMKPSQLLSYRVVVAALVATLGYQVFAASMAIRDEVQLPYSGAEDMAKYLKPLVKEGKVIYGFQYGMVAINAYFDHNIFANLNRAYYHHSVSEYNPQQLSDALRAAQADYIVIQYWDPFDEADFRRYLRIMAAWGYQLDHFSDGYMMTKTGASHTQIYMVFKKQLP